MSVSGREDLANVSSGEEASLMSMKPSLCPGVVRRPSRLSRSDRDTLLDVREWSGGPPRCTGVVGRP